MPNSKLKLKDCQRVLNFGQKGKIPPNLVTLVSHVIALNQSSFVYSEMWSC